MRVQRAWVTRLIIPKSDCVNLDGPGPDSGLAELTARETQVLELMAQGLTNGAIERLVISEATVRKHVGGNF